MPVIYITVESSFTNQGFLQISIEDSFIVQELIQQYCDIKGIPVNPSYTVINRENLAFDGNKPLSYYGIKDNEPLILSIIMDKTRTYRFGHWFTLAGLGFLFGLLGMTICIILFVVIRTVPDNYAVVVDAGSTHSDVILYKWPGLKLNNTGEVKQVSTCYVTGGIAQVLPGIVSDYFNKCFTSVQHQIPPQSRPNAEVLFGATAGMRLLNESDPSKAKATIDEVKQYLKATKLVVKETNVGVISGSSEGISGWITINFLKDTIYSEVGDLNASFGALDLGGASTQITFEVSAENKDLKRVKPLNLFGHKFFVFSQSFLCYGVVQALLRYRALLIQDQIISNATSINVTSPCEPLGRILTLNESDFNTPCLKSSKIVLFSKTVKTYNFVGSNDYSGCQRSITNLLNLETCVKSGWKSCMDSSIIPKDVNKRKFMGFSSFAYVANTLMIKENTTKKEYEEKVQHLCALSFKQLQELKDKNDKNKLKDLETSCFKAQLVLTILSDIYGFNTEEKWSSLQFTTKINGTSLGWSLGYMVNATEEIAAGNSVPQLPTVPFALLLVLFALFLIISIGFAFHGIKLRKSASYQRLLTS